MSDLRQIFDSYSRMTVKTGLTFDSVGSQNVVMDVSEVCTRLPSHTLEVFPRCVSQLFGCDSSTASFASIT